MKSLFNLFLILCFFSSCSNYVSSLHKEFDRDLYGNQPTKQADSFSLYRKNKQANQFNRYSSGNMQNVLPSVQRNYVQRSTYQKRYKADDLVDNSGSGSLWVNGDSKPNSLYTKNKFRSNGDIVLIQVANKLKTEITAELKRAFPRPKPTAKKDAKAPAGEEAPATAGGEEANSSGSAESQIYDRISSVVIEEINKDHILLRGRKNLLYHNQKRLVEIQALVSRRDILDDDTVNSDNIIESAITVIR